MDTMIQNKYLLFLKDLKFRCENEKLTSMNEVIQDHKIQSGIGTVVRLMGLVKKEEGTIKWSNGSDVSDELSVKVEDEFKLYGFCSNNMDYFNNLLKYGEGACIDFNKAFRFLGFTRRDHAKYSLLNNCEIDKDFYLPNNREITPIFDEKRADFEVIKLTPEGFLKWSMNACTPVAIDRREELIRNFFKLRDLLKEKDHTLNEHAGKSWLLEGVSLFAKNIQKYITKLGDHLQENNKNKLQLEMTLGYDATETHLKGIINEFLTVVNERNYEAYIDKHVMKESKPKKTENGNLQLPEGC